LFCCREKRIIEISKVGLGEVRVFPGQWIVVESFSAHQDKQMDVTEIKATQNTDSGKCAIAVIL